MLGTLATLAAKRRPHGGMIYFHLLLDGLADAGHLEAVGGGAPRGGGASTLHDSDPPAKRSKRDMRTATRDAPRRLEWRVNADLRTIAHVPARSRNHRYRRAHQ
ncbi:hypothetical protein [Ferrimicrobium acidiphilum]|uniref:Transposase n=1 Tax=Ferrimicrobium acidiphilum TaxID=121039 RepID=A0ABV3Y317_9ACTN